MCAEPNHRNETESKVRFIRELCIESSLTEKKSMMGNLVKFGLNGRSLCESGSYQNKKREPGDDYLLYLFHNLLLTFRAL